MKQENKIIIAIILGAIIIGLFILIAILIKPSYEPIPISGKVINEIDPIEKMPTEEYHEVIRIVDGDTIRIDNGESVRLICIDTPERGEDGYKEASDYLESLILNQQVKLTKDVSDRGKYGRLVRYIYNMKGDFINEIMVRQGYAEAYPYNPDTKLCPQIIEAEKKAREERLGIWAEDEEDEEDEEKLDDSEYDCSGNVYNCGDFKTHNAAQLVFDYCGGVSNDVHRLDQDNDGEACETLS
jgi:endonuclease YncB( thermonuclease family)